jgi:hypothetical protein
VSKPETNKRSRWELKSVEWIRNGEDTQKYVHEYTPQFIIFQTLDNTTYILFLIFLQKKISSFYLFEVFSPGYVSKLYL